MDLASCVARFCWAYPGEFRGGTIGWGLFWLLYERLHVVLAVGRVNTTRAVGLAWVADGAAQLMQQDIEEAFEDG